MEDSVFTKIIRGEIPGHKIYEDDKTLAILDIHPYVPGHVLVIPKIQVDHFDDLEPSDYRALFDAVKKVAKHLKKELACKRVCVRIMGFDVPHAHVHVYPCNTSKDFYGDFGDTDRMSIAPDNSALDEMAKKLAFK